MFQNLVEISPANDAATRFTRGSNWQFAANVPTVMVTRDEMAALAKEYAVVFSDSAPYFPMALLGFDGKNNYVNPEGKWRARHIPARISMFPFCSGRLDGKAVMLRAADAPHFKGQDGVPLYDAAGQPTDFLSQVIEQEARTAVGLASATQLTGQLVDAGLIRSAEMKLTLADGSERTINGFKAVNEAALAALDGESRARLAASGAMAMLEAHKASLANLGRLFAAAPSDAAAPAKKARKPRATAMEDKDAADAAPALAKKVPAKKAAAPKRAAKAGATTSAATATAKKATKAAK